jgi:hypothetical protein
MNKVDTICPWCYEVQDTGIIRKMTRLNEYMEQGETDADDWREVVNTASEVCKNCGKDYIWRFKTIVVAEATRVQWAVPMSATAMTPKVVGLIPYPNEEKDDAES